MNNQMMFDMIILVYVLTKTSLLMDYARAVSFKNVNITTDPQHRTKLKLIDRFCDANDRRFDHPFSHVFTFGNMFPESHGFVAASIIWTNNFVSLH